MKRRQFVATLSGMTAALALAPFAIRGGSRSFVDTSGSMQGLEGYASLEFCRKGWFFKPMDKQILFKGDYVYIEVPQSFHGNGFTGPVCFRVADEVGRREYRIVPVENIFVQRVRQIRWVMKVKYARVRTFYAEGDEQPYQYMWRSRDVNILGGKAFYDEANQILPMRRSWKFAGNT